MLLLFILHIVCIIQKSCPLLCYNGTFTHRRYGQDPLDATGLFSPSHKTLARSRCWLTISCSGLGELNHVVIQPSAGHCWTKPRPITATDYDIIERFLVYLLLR